MTKEQLLQYFDFVDEMIRGGAFGEDIRKYYLDVVQSRKLNKTERRLLVYNLLKKAKKYPNVKKIIRGIDALFLIGTYYGKKYNLDNIIKAARKGAFTPSFFRKHYKQLNIVRRKYFPKFKEDVSKYKKGVKKTKPTRDINLLEAAGTTPEGITVATIAQARKNVDRLKERLKEMWEKGREAIERGYRMLELQREKIEPYQEYASLLRKDIQIGEDVATALQQSKLQEAVYGGGFAKQTERVLRSGLQAEQDIQMMEDVMPEKIKYEDFKKAIEEYRKLLRDETEYKKYLDYQQLKQRIAEIGITKRRKSKQIETRMKNIFTL